MSDHDSITDGSIIEQTKKTYKRRSSILQVNRRFQDNKITSDETDDNSGNQRTTNGERKSFDLPTYIQRLKLERQCWKDTLHKRKSRRRNLQKKSFTIKKQGDDPDAHWRICDR
ncbi:uncharacterized protein [Venturia canescens]|uniref:uncharacterized protein isoform X2 n=1 Tax=Venturia canescens TaxID=32260 RepID=UPI001C9C2FB5|nr:uncharacterized protein LOC122410738 isoform X2 [Venturia canescens]